MNRIAELRKKQKLSQHQFSKLLDVDSTTLIKIAEFFKVSTDYLLGLTDTASPIVKEKTPSYQEEVIQDLEDITPDMASEIRQYISYLKHKKEAATNTVAEKK